MLGVTTKRRFSISVKIMQYVSQSQQTIIYSSFLLFLTKYLYFEGRKRI